MRERAEDEVAGADLLVLVDVVELLAAVEVSVGLSVEVSAVEVPAVVSVDSGADDSGVDAAVESVPDDSPLLDPVGWVISVDDPAEVEPDTSGSDWTELDPLGGTAAPGPTSAVPPTV